MLPEHTKGAGEQDERVGGTAHVARRSGQTIVAHLRPALLALALLAGSAGAGLAEPAALAGGQICSVHTDLDEDALEAFGTPASAVLAASVRQSVRNLGLLATPEQCAGAARPLILLVDIDLTPVAEEVELQAFAITTNLLERSPRGVLSIVWQRLSIGAAAEDRALMLGVIQERSRAHLKTLAQQLLTVRHAPGQN